MHDMVRTHVHTHKGLYSESDDKVDDTFLHNLSSDGNESGSGNGSGSEGGASLLQTLTHKQGVWARVCVVEEHQAHSNDDTVLRSLRFNEYAAILAVIFFFFFDKLWPFIMFFVVSFFEAFWL